MISASRSTGIHPIRRRKPLPMGLTARLRTAVSCSVVLALCLAPVPGFAQVVINEILPNPVGSDTGTERVEVYNAGGVAVDMTGLGNRRRGDDRPGRHARAHSGGPRRFVFDQRDHRARRVPRRDDDRWGGDPQQHGRRRLPGVEPRPRRDGRSLGDLPGDRGRRPGVGADPERDEQLRVAHADPVREQRRRR